MLRLRRLTQLLFVLCACAFISALLSIVIYRVLSMTALPFQDASVINDIKALEDISKLREIAVLLVGVSTELRTSGDTLAKWGLGFVLIWSAILGAITSAIYRQIRKVQNVVEMQLAETENLFDLALAGKLELWKVFWGGYVALSFVSMAAFAGIVKLLLPTGADTQSSFLLSVLVGPIVLAIPIAIYLCCATLVWRSASNTSSPLWHYTAKAVVIVCTVLPLLKSVYITGVILKLYG